MTNTKLSASVLYVLIPGLLLLTSCKFSATVNQEQEITDTETAFMKACGEHGIANAFYEFADENAIIKRENDTLITGRSAIHGYYNKPFFSNATVEWKPDFIDVADSKDIAYSYGKYKWVFTDSTGAKSEYSGVYMTVWKKQADNSWKYVWD